LCKKPSQPREGRALREKDDVDSLTFNPPKALPRKTVVEGERCREGRWLGRWTTRVKNSQLRIQQLFPKI